MKAFGIEGMHWVRDGDDYLQRHRRDAGRVRAGAGGHWRQTVVAVPGGSGPCALTATADGVLLACVDGSAIRCLRR